MVPDTHCDQYGLVCSSEPRSLDDAEEAWIVGWSRDTTQKTEEMTRRITAARTKATPPVPGCLPLFDRRVPQPLVDALAEGGSFAWVTDLARRPMSSATRPLDLGLRASLKLKGAGHATLYLGTTQVLGIHVTKGCRFRLSLISGAASSIRSSPSSTLIGLHRNQLGDSRDRWPPFETTPRRRLERPPVAG